MIVGLGLLNTGIVYLTYYYIVEKAGTVFVSTVVYIPPILVLSFDIFAFHHDVGVNSYLAIFFLAALALIELDPARNDQQFVGHY